MIKAPPTRKPWLEHIHHGRSVTMLVAAQETARESPTPAGWRCEWLLEAAAANAAEVGTYLAQCGVW